MGYKLNKVNCKFFLISQDKAFFGDKKCYRNSKNCSDLGLQSSLFINIGY